MYIPELYKNENPDEIREFIIQNSFGILINQTNGKLWGTHIPLVLTTDQNGKEFLYGHISKENPQGDNFRSNPEVLAIFSGPHAYISSSWYDHENVPTWNYTAVHVYGKITIIDGSEMMDSIRNLVNKYEADSANPISVDSLSEETMKQISGITAFKIEISEIQAVKKTSQNRDLKNKKTIISELEKRKDPGSKDIAQMMQKDIDSDLNPTF